MIQLIITILIVLAATAIACYRFVRFFYSPPHKCSGCSQLYQCCPLDDLKINSVPEKHNQKIAKKR